MKCARSIAAECLGSRGGCGSIVEGDAMTIAEIAKLSVLIACVVVSVWLGFLHREF